MTTPLFHVDAFTERAFAGNPAGVCVLEDEREDAWMQSVAAELNLSETAFLRRTGPSWSLRWFTPIVEVDLCGHATLASAHALWESGRADAAARLEFDTRSGRLAASRNSDETVELDFPSEPAAPDSLPDGLLEALGVLPESVRWTGRNRLDLVVELEDESAVRALAPQFSALGDACGGTRGLIATARSSGADFDFVSRFFAPAAGIDEDPVTGSAHCCLGPFWAKRLGKETLVGYQASKRGGTVTVRVAGSRVALSGRAVTVARGEIL